MVNINALEWLSECKRLIHYSRSESAHANASYVTSSSCVMLIASYRIHFCSIQYEWRTNQVDRTHLLIQKKFSYLCHEYEDSMRLMVDR